MPLTSEQKEQARFYIRRYLERCEENRATKHYSQARPMNHLGKSPAAEWTCDCSGIATSCFRWADIKLPFKVNDPNGTKFNYNGYGYTGTLLANNTKRRVPLDRKFFVGDLALYGPSLSDTRHVCICRKNGDAAKSIWTSHGSETGPYSVYLHYRSDFLCVVRTLDLA
jgi:hypothetical protein